MTIHQLFQPIRERIDAIKRGDYFKFPTKYDSGSILTKFRQDSYNFDPNEIIPDLDQLINQFDQLKEDIESKPIPVYLSKNWDDDNLFDEGYERLSNDLEFYKSGLEQLLENLEANAVPSVQYEVIIRANSFAYLIGLMERTGIIKVGTKTVMHKFLSKHFKPQNIKAKWSEGTIRNAYYFPRDDSKDVTITRDSLEKMISYLDDDVKVRLKKN